MFKCLQEGKKYYTVRLNGHALFTGTTGECERFLAIHQAKVCDERELERKPRRNRAVTIRTYRQARTSA
ncbi:MAG: hypothetical protein P1V36_02265 [Planctomycetota bacterium]|nr:hypothetical protein [Planctomycetota bacterium]